MSANRLKLKTKGLNITPTSVATAAIGDIRIDDATGELRWHNGTSEQTVGSTGDVAAHSAETDGVHGVTGDVVGTTDTQSLSNKTITASSIGSTSPSTGGFTTATAEQVNITTGTLGIGIVDPAAKIHVNAAPSADDSYGLITLGNGDFSGDPGSFTGNASGNFIALNTVPGFAGDLLNFQIDGAPVFVVDADGVIAADGSNLVNLDATELVGQVAIANGGTGAATKAAGFDALSPMTTGGDLIYGGASGTGTRLANGSAGQYLRSAGSTSAPAWTTFTPPTVTIINSGTGTYTTPANCVRIEVEMVGGGGGGSGSGSADSSSNGGAGGDTTFGTALLTAAGGGGGTWSGSTGGTGGSPTVNSPAVEIAAFIGATGSAAGYKEITTVQLSGAVGASTVFGGGGAARGGGIGGLAAKANTGSGGSGGGAGSAAGNIYTGTAGGAGAYLRAQINAPSATYDYAVGAAGTAGGAGTDGFVGGTGAAGKIIVREYYQ